MSVTMSDVADVIYEAVGKGYVGKLGEHLSSFGEVYFTGWKPHQSSSRLCGQWLAYPPEDWPERERGPFYAITVPNGDPLRYARGDEFPIVPDGKLYDPRGVTYREVEVELKRQLKRLMLFIIIDNPPWLAKMVPYSEDQVGWKR